jgi:hypothetical protein
MQLSFVGVILVVKVYEIQQLGVPFSPHLMTTTTNIQESNQENTHGTFREHSERVERTLVSHPNCKKHFKKVPRLTQNGTFREHSGNIRGTFREC